MNTPQEAEYRVNLKRELRAKGIKVNSSESTTNLERLLAGEILPTPVKHSDKLEIKIQDLTLGFSVSGYDMLLFVEGERSQIAKLEEGLTALSALYGCLVQKSVFVSYSGNYIMKVKLSHNEKNALMRMLDSLKLWNEYIHFN